jgi:hypothetical protein
MDNHTPEYLAYLNSFTWHLKRWLRLNYAGHKCENCGSREKLQCHHRTYERLFHERISDLQILCEDCHLLADAQRRYDKAVNTFATKKWGAAWVQVMRPDEAKAEFDRWLESKQSR